MARTSTKDPHRNAEGRVGAYLRRYGVPLRPVTVVIDTDLAEDTLATHRLPATVVLRQASTPESVVAHELVHIAQSELDVERVGVRVGKDPGPASVEPTCRHLGVICGGRVGAWGVAPDGVTWELRVRSGRAPLPRLRGDAYV